MIRVLICDDHLIVRQGIKQVLAEAEDIRTVGEAASGPEALQLARAIQLDVVLLDIAMPQRDGLDILKALKSEFPRLPVLMLSTYPDRQYAVRSLKLGAAGYLNKSADSEQMIDAVRSVARGKLFITPSVAELLAGAVGAGGHKAGDDEQPLQEKLSHREHQVFQLLAAGRSVGEIAEQLVLSPNTVSTYRARVLEKIGVRNDVELALFAVRAEQVG
ncbi:response regulator transcription factor [Roseateles asaccharophilus]|uniref:DNA-binding NarL/FixJ family response regulator n=1 Tax=Roseateles asaccharophilus TaxID=582607 RepID=A0ABU2A664_9BURK|nr:response regulator transcription factor [Roseateles asaccharophilus]MDR7332098.1 DNA-binding NarL/FixJ family response regulator [Roseateles asaccharophilus]